MDLFTQSQDMNMKKAAPLAARMRPRNLDEFVGQAHIIGKGKLLRRAIEADQLSSVIFYGPPGVGKTTLARIIAQTTKSEFYQLSAITAGVGDIRDIIKKAQDNLGFYGKKSVLFIDEIHRFNKGQQDALLPAVEDGLLVLIGATTENPYFQVNGALLSRSRIFQLKELTEADILTLLHMAIVDKERGLGNYRTQITEDALQHIAAMAGGDGRSALNALELAVITTPVGQDGYRHIDLSVAEDSIQQKAVAYDKDGDHHYNVISAFIKSMRGSDPDATLHWLARMIEAGEKPEFIMRRILICAAEDVGLADPQCLQVAVSAMQAVNFVGWPEARIPLAMAAVYVATAPKSNAAYMGIDLALADVKSKNCGNVPAHLKDAHYPGAKNFGHGKGYLYPHEFDGYVAQQYLPDELQGVSYYHPTNHGYEDKISSYLQMLQEKQNKTKKNQ